MYYFLICVLNLIYKPIFIVAVSVGILSFLGLLFIFIIQLLFFIFDDASSSTLLKAIPPLSMLPIDMALLKEMRSDKEIMLIVFLGAVGTFLMAAVFYSIDERLKILKTAHNMRILKQNIVNNNMTAAFQFLNFNLNRQVSVERNIGRVDEMNITAYVDENAITGYLRNALYQTAKYLEKSQIDMALTTIDHWLKKPRL